MFTKRRVIWCVASIAGKSDLTVRLKHFEVECWAFVLVLQSLVLSALFCGLPWSGLFDIQSHTKQISAKKESMMFILENWSSNTTITSDGHGEVSCPKAIKQLWRWRSSMLLWPQKRKNANPAWKGKASSKSPQPEFQIREQNKPMRKRILHVALFLTNPKTMTK